MSNDYLLELGFLVQEPDDDVCRSVSALQINEGGGDIFIEGDLLPIQRDGETEVKTIAWPKEVIFDENFFRSIYAGSEPIPSATQYIEFQDGNETFKVNFMGELQWNVASPAGCANIGINLTPGRAYLGIMNYTGALKGSSNRGGETRFNVTMHGQQILKASRGYNLESNVTYNENAYAFAWPSDAQVPPTTLQNTKWDYYPGNKSKFDDQVCKVDFYDVGDAAQVTVHNLDSDKVQTAFTDGTIKAGDFVVVGTAGHSGYVYQTNSVFKVSDPNTSEVFDIDGRPITIEWGSYNQISHNWARTNLVDANEDPTKIANTMGVKRELFIEFSTDYEPPAPPVPLNELILDDDLVPCAVIADGAAKTIEGSEFKKLFFDLTDWTELPGGVKIINGGRNCEITKTAGGPNNWDPFVKIVIEDEWLDDDYVYSMCPPTMSGNGGGGIDMLDKGRSYASAEFGFQATTGKITVNETRGKFGSQWTTNNAEDMGQVNQYSHYNWLTAQEMRDGTFGFRWQIDNRAARSWENYDLATINPYIMRMPAALQHEFNDYKKVNDFFGEELLDSNNGLAYQFDKQPLADQSIPEGTLVYTHSEQNVRDIVVYLEDGQKKYLLINNLTYSNIISGVNTYYVKKFTKLPSPDEAAGVEHVYPAGEFVDWHFEVI